MPSPRRLLALAVGVAFMAAFAVLPSPRLWLTRSPSVAPALSGDVRRMSFIVTPDGVIQAVVEVRIECCWRGAYWTNIPGVTPESRVATYDLLDYGESVAGGSGEWFGSASVVRAGSGYEVVGMTKKLSWWSLGNRRVISKADQPTGKLSLAVISDGSLHVAYASGGRLWFSDGKTSEEIPGREGAQDTRPALAIAGDRTAIAFERAGRVMLAERSAGSWTVKQIAASGKAPALAWGGSGWRIAWADGVLEHARILERDPSGRVTSVTVHGGKTFLPSVNVADGLIAAWTTDSGAWILDGGRETKIFSGRVCCAAVAAAGSRHAFGYLRYDPTKDLFRAPVIWMDGHEQTFESPVTLNARPSVTATPAALSR